ncbi:alpha/beta hydrolase family esterase [Rhizosphaericola mali]|uniref:Esterase n=1 Tax=Rhizosphaericola mali TaxID=2545455 RepID=A0A5P2G544_9BACT|nr:alpha/beta hydrolase-fold protein [Rhizosphaericola mali]QES89808.1 esterase [Rhizosphaericola mali]
MFKISKYLLIVLLFSGINNLFAQITGSTQMKSWTVDGITRKALVYIPNLATTQDAPIIFLFHGHGGNMETMLQTHDFRTLWPEAILVVPQGLNTPGGLVDRQGRFSGWQQNQGDMQDRDIHFFDQILDSLKSNFHVDTNRVFVTGHSNGGSFAYLLWAMRGNKIAAVASSAGLSFQIKIPLSPKPVMQIMGTKDPLVKPAWQKMEINLLKKLNSCSDNAEMLNKNVFLYPSKTNTPVEVYIHDKGHIYPQESLQSVVDFFKSCN